MRNGANHSRHHTCKVTCANLSHACPFEVDTLVVFLRLKTEAGSTGSESNLAFHALSRRDDFIEHGINVDDRLHGRKQTRECLSGFPANFSGAEIRFLDLKNPCSPNGRHPPSLPPRRHHPGDPRGHSQRCRLPRRRSTGSGFSFVEVQKSSPRIKTNLALGVLAPSLTREFCSRPGQDIS